MIYAFQNVEEFKELFGTRETGNGQIVRKNKILLGFLKDRTIHNYIRDNLPAWQDDFFKFRDVTALYNACIRIIMATGDGYKAVRTPEGVFYNSDYETDEMKGICEDGSVGYIRYRNVNDGRIYKMKAGKMFKHLILQSEFGRALPESTVLYLCEEFTRRWETYVASKLPEYKLVVDDDFGKIYNGDECKGYFGSCMTDDGLWTFYRDYVKAKAAYLLNNEGLVIARCVIFTEVHEEGSDKVWRLAERQYSTEGDELLKRCLVEALIRGGHIDGYKSVGAGCHEARTFVANDGTSLSSKKFWIECTLGFGDTLSYQDSFKWLDMDEEVAYNYENCDARYRLDTTEGQIEDDEEDENYDEYHNTYTTNDVISVHYNGRWMTCDEDCLDDFIDVGGDYYHEDEVSCCPYCDEYYISDDGVYSELTRETYCCEDCLKEAEEEYKQDNWYYAEIDEDYFEDEDDVTSVHIWNQWNKTYEERSISVELLELRVDDGTYVEYEGEYYNTLEHIEAA